MPLAIPRTNIADTAAILLLVSTGSLRQKLIAPVSAGCVAAAVSPQIYIRTESRDVDAVNTINNKELRLIALMAN